MLPNPASRPPVQDSELTSKIRLRPSMFRFWAYWAAFLIGVPVCTVVALALEEAGVPALTRSGARLIAWLPLIFPLLAVFRKYNVRYDLNEKTLVVTKGLLTFSRSYSGTHYADILGVDARQSFISLLFNMADLSVGTADTSTKEFLLIGVRKWRPHLALLKTRVEHARTASHTAARQA